jgi:hypothetical protein
MVDLLVDHLVALMAAMMVLKKADLMEKMRIVLKDRTMVERLVTMMVDESVEMMDLLVA